MFVLDEPNNAASSSYITRGKTVNRILLLSPCGGSWNIILGYLGPPDRLSCRTHVFVVTSVARTFRSRFEVPSRVRRAKARERKVELASFRFFGNVRAMAGSWGGHTASSEELWSSLFTVVHADWADLRPLLDRFDLDDLVTLTCAAGLTTRPQSTPSTKATPKTCVSQR